MENLVVADENSNDSEYVSPIASAIARLSTALDKLETVADQRSTVKEPGEEMQRMSEDRAKLARELDAEKARGNQLAQVNGEVSKRLVGVMETVRNVLDDDSAGKPRDE